MGVYETGAVIGVGASNLREAMIGPDGSPGGIHKIGTPALPEEFFGVAARSFLNANQQGAEWGVMGIPGPVSVVVDSGDRVKQHMRVTNIEALQQGFDPVEEMIRAEPAFGRLVEAGFTYLTVNDGKLAAQAGAKLYGTTSDREYGSVAALIDGTGIGGDIVRRDHRFPGRNLFHPDPGLWEVGHNILQMSLPSQTIESTASGTALEVHTGLPAEQLEENDPAWNDVAHGLGHQVLNLGINGGAELVVISGSNGIHGYYGHAMMRLLTTFQESRNPMADKVPDVKIVPREPRTFTDEYELHGAQGAMVSHLTTRVIDNLVMLSVDIGGTKISQS